MEKEISDKAEKCTYCGKVFIQKANGRYKFNGFHVRGNKRQIGIKFTHRKLSVIPWSVQDIHGKETELGDGSVDCTVRKAAFSLEPFDKIPEFLPGNIFGIFVKDMLKVVQISADIGAVVF